MPDTNRTEAEQNRRPLTMDNLSDEQINTLKDIWQEIKSSDSSTPMADLRSRMTDSGLFNFGSQYDTNNMELRQLASESELADNIIAARRKIELKAIVDATEGKNTEVEMLRALQEAGILPEGSGVRMSGREIVDFVLTARRDLEEITRAEGGASPEDGGGAPSSEQAPQPEQEAEDSGESEDDDEQSTQETEADNSGDNEVRDEDPLKVIALDTSVDLRQAAIDFANKRLTDELNSQGGFFKKFARRIWKGNLAKDYYRAKYAREAEGLMLADENFLSKDASPGQVAEAKRALFERFGLEYDEAIHQAAGESKNVLTNDSPFAVASKELIQKYVENTEGNFNEDALKQELNRLLKEHSEGENPEIPGGDLLKVSNLMDVAQAVKARVEHGQSIDNVLENMQFITGEARTGVRTDLHETTVDKLFEKMQKSKNGRLRAISPDALLVAAGVAGSLVGLGGKRLTATALTLIPGASGAVIAGWRENKRTKEDRIQHMREMAQGGSIEDGSKRREEMEGARYETQSASNLVEALHELSTNLGDDSDRKTAINNALKGLADINTRIRLGDEKGADLISFSSQENIGAERLELDVARAQLRAEIDQVLGALSADERSALGVGDGNAGELVEGLSGEFVDVLNTDISAKDRAFQKLRAKRIAKAAAVGFGVGLTYGLISQEVVASLSGGRQGLVEELWNGRDTPAGADGKINQTMLASWIRGEDDLVIPSAYSGNMVQSAMPGPNGGTITMPEGMSFKPSGSGGYALIDKDGGTVLDGVMINNKGELDPASIGALQGKGFNLSSNSHEVVTPGQDRTVVRTYNNPGDYVQKNGGTRIASRSWADNGTRVPDKNELRGWEMGVRQDGTIDYSVHTMTENGSYGQGLPVNWREAAADGKLVAYISGSKGSQNYAFEIPIGPDGKFAIPPDHPAYKFFDVKPGEEWKAGENFKGGYIEIAEKTVNPDGSVDAHMLATEVGTNSGGSITETEVVPGESIKTVVTNYDMTPPSAEVIPIHTDMAPSIPIVGRKSLERLAKERNPYGYGYEYNGAGSEAEVNKIVAERSPRLVSNPEAKLNPAEELNWYRNELASRRGESAVASMDTKIANSPELRDLSNSTETIVMVPVAAAQEADTIYRTLSLYGQQDKEALSKSLVLLNLNWLDEIKTDTQKMAKVDKARQEIERARRDFPDLKIAVAENEYSAKKAKETGGIIGYAVSDLADTALLAMQKRVQDGSISNDHDILLIRNDADPEGLSRHYLQQYQKSFSDSKNEGIDVLKGVTRFGARWANKYPGFAAASNFAAGLSAALSHRGLPATGGANFGIRASTLAAVGGLGKMEYTGPGSDDGALGRRIRYARWGVGVSRRQSDEPKDYYRVARHVAGATVDTNPSRLIPYHLEGAAYSDAWRPENYSGSDGIYSERAAGRNVNPDGRSEIAGDWNTEFKAIENTISSELSWNGIDDGRRVLAIFFGDAPGSYTLTGEGQSTRFRLTKKGRQYLKTRFTHEPDGKRGRYGDRLMRSLYGVASPNGRQPLAPQSPLIQPLDTRQA